MPEPAPQRVAIIVVHGVADQRSGETARAVVDLLVASSPPGVDYAAATSEAITVPVDPLPPLDPPTALRHATPDARDKPLIKALAQSLRSDFQRQEWKAPETVAAAWQGVQPATPSLGAAEPVGAAAAVALGAPEPEPDDVDRGIQASNFLLSKHLENGAHRESYETTRIGMQRSQGGLRTEVDVFEMYWADLSRLSGAIPRIVTELFTMIFRLSKLARETVDEARGTLKRSRGRGGLSGLYAGSWWLTTVLQIALDWLFVNGLAMLMLQLALLGGLLLALGFLDQLGAAVLPRVHQGVTALVGVGGVLLTLYRWRDANWKSMLLPLAAIALGAGVLIALPTWTPWVSVLLVFAVAGLASEAGLRIAEERFPFVRPVGRWMGLTLAFLMLMSVARQLDHGAPHAGLDLWLRAVLFGVELTLFSIKWLWIVMGVLLAAWIVAGSVASLESGYESKASVATGRLGLGLSIGAFLATTMAIWAMLSGGLGSAVDSTRYAPCLFVMVPAPATPPPLVEAVAGTQAACKKVDPCAPPARVDAPPERASPSEDACLWVTGDMAEERARNGMMKGGARPYLQRRYEQTTATFSLLAVVLLSLLAYLVTMFVPSILAELKLLVQRAGDAARKAMRRRYGHRLSKEQEQAAAAVRGMRTRRLGRWLTAGYRHLDRVAYVVFVVGVLLGLAVALSFYGVALFDRYEARVAEWSVLLLKPLVITAAGIVGVLVAFGGLLSKHLPALRGPLDIALDVDNHFREFPRTGIPRARIFSRYAALLREVRAGRYDRIVVVAHSQGTVISAELLRYLASDGRHAPAAGAKPLVGGHELAPFHLLTLGCPLRQLYAARFPTLYRWVIARHQAVSGPRAADIGVLRWMNAFCSGDYVGRWLWSDHPPEDTDPVGHPMLDRVDARNAFGRSDTYAGFDPMPPAVAPLASNSEIEVCLGLGAHTHYFEPEQTTVAWLIDHLVAH